MIKKRRKKILNRICVTFPINNNFNFVKMSLYTVTFDSSDSGDLPITPLRVGQISPPPDKPKQKRVIRRKVRNSQPSDGNDIKITKQKVDINEMREEERLKKLQTEIDQQLESVSDEENGSSGKNGAGASSSDGGDVEIKNVQRNTRVKRERKRRTQTTPENNAQKSQEGPVKRLNLGAEEEETQDIQIEIKRSPTHQQPQQMRRRQRDVGNSTPERKEQVPPRVPGQPLQLAAEEEDMMEREKRAVPQRKDENSSETSNDEHMIEIFKQSQNQQSSDCLKYVFRYKNQISIKGRRITMSLSYLGETLYCAKLKSKSTEEMFIFKGSECHLKATNYDSVLLIGNDNLSFSLRKNNKFGPELCNLKFTIPDHKSKPRQCALHLFGDDLTLPNDIFTRPFICKNGKFLVRTNKGSALPSIKNCVLVDKDDRDMITILKVQENEMALDAHKDFDPLIVFAVGASSYLCQN